MTNLQLIKTKYQSHSYHLVDQSPWPILISWTLFFMAIGAVLSMHGYNNGGYLLALGFLLTSTVMYFWLSDVHIEGTYLGNHTKEVKNGLMLGFILFVIDESGSSWSGGRASPPRAICSWWLSSWLTPTFPCQTICPLASLTR